MSALWPVPNDGKEAMKHGKMVGAALALVAVVMIVTYAALSLMAILVQN